jgi:hypothetical protein
VANMLKNSWTLAVSVAINISMKLCFVSVNGPRETYFVDEPHTFKLGSSESFSHILEDRQPTRWMKMYTQNFININSWSEERQEFWGFNGGEDTDCGLLGHCFPVGSMAPKGGHENLFWQMPEMAWSQTCWMNFS